VPLTRVKGLTTRTADRLLAARERGPFSSLADFFHRVGPSGEELEAMIRVGAFDEFGDTRTWQFWQGQHLLKTFGAGGTGDSPVPSGDPPDGMSRRTARVPTSGLHTGASPVPLGESPSGAGGSPAPPRYGQPWLLPPPGLEQLLVGRASPRAGSSSLPSLREPTHRERLEWETELFGFAVSGHPLELFADVAWDTYCPVNRLGEFAGQTVTTCGLVVEQRTHHQITGEPMKFLTLADWTGMVETELFAQTYKTYGLATVRYPVLEITAKVEPFESGLGFSLRVLRAGAPRKEGFLDVLNRPNTVRRAPSGFPLPSTGRGIEGEG